MDAILFNRLAKSNASTECRTGIRDFIIEHPGYFAGLVAFATDLSNKNQHKAVWIIELLAETHPQLFNGFVDLLCETIPKFKHESAIRGSSRTIYFLSIAKTISLNAAQTEKLIEICLDWLIGDAKVAPKAYALYTLGHYAREEAWLEAELRNIINKDYHLQSAGYKAAAKEVLRKISK